MTKNIDLVEKQYYQLQFTVIQIINKILEAD